MWNLITAPENQIFGIALALMLLLGVLEVLSMLLGGASEWLDNLLPTAWPTAPTPKWGWTRPTAWWCGF